MNAEVAKVIRRKTKMFYLVITHYGRLL